MRSYVKVARGARYEVLPWIEDFIVKMYALDERGYLIHSRNLLSCAKKNGKTELAAVLVLNALCGPYPVPAGARVVSAAGSKEQAGDIFNKVHWMLLQNKKLADLSLIHISEPTRPY